MKKLITLLVFLIPFISVGQRTIHDNLIVTDTITSQGLDDAINGNKQIIITPDGKFIQEPNTIVVLDTGDFPTSVAGVHTLAENTIYVISAPIVTPNRFVLPKVGCLMSASGLVGTITYTGADTMLIATELDGFTISDVVFFNVGTGTALDISTKPVSFFGAFIIQNTGFIGFNTVGVIRNASTRLTNTSFLVFTNGLTIDSSLVYQMTGCLFDNSIAASSPFLTMEGVHSLINIKNNNLETLAGDEVLDIDPAIVLTEAVISGNIYRNGVSDWFAVGSLTEEDIRFTYSDNGDAPESSENAFISIGTPIAETVVAGTFEKVDGTYSAGVLNRFTHSAGVLTYIGRKTQAFTITSSISLTTLNNNRTVDLRVAKNGTSVAESNQRRFMSVGADVGALPITYVLELSTGDTIELQYTTVSTDTDITAEFLNLSIQ